MESSAVGSTGQTTRQSTVGTDALRDLDLSDFIGLLIAELQNQDPLNPMDNSEMLQQITQIREIDSTTRLGNTLDSVLLGQNIASGANLLGKEVLALTDANAGLPATMVNGIVDQVSITDGNVKLRIGGYTVDLKNVSQIRAPSPDDTAGG